MEPQSDPGVKALCFTKGLPTHSVGGDGLLRWFLNMSSPDSKNLFWLIYLLDRHVEKGAVVRLPAYSPYSKNSTNTFDFNESVALWQKAFIVSYFCVQLRGPILFWNHRAMAVLYCYSTKPKSMNVVI